MAGVGGPTGSSVEVVLSKAHALYLKHDFAGASHLCKQAFGAGNEGHCPLLLLLSAALFSERKLDESLMYCQQAVSVNPSFAEAWGNMGE